MSFNLLKIRQLDRKLEKFKNISGDIPQKGWINEIRNAIKLTYAQSAKRINVSPPAVKRFEDSEIKGTISLNSIRKIAESMNCKLVYAIVPDETLEKIIDSQIEEVATKIVRRTSHSMNLESQKLNTDEEAKMIDELKMNLKTNFSNKIWNYEV